jgi:TonB family protein
MKKSNLQFKALLLSIVGAAQFVNAAPAGAGDTKAVNQPQHQARTYVLEGQIEMEVDPDRNDKDVLVEWDEWRNNVVRAAWSNWGKALEGGISIGTFKLAFGGHRTTVFQDGTNATFQFRVNADRRIEDIRITHSSGDEQFDQLVLNSVRALDRKAVLQFPSDSRRKFIEQACTFRICGSTNFQEGRFGDSEHYVKPQL